MQDIAAEWESLGTALRITPAELDNISSMSPLKKCLRGVLLAWLQQRYDTKRFGQPSWRKLCQAVHKPAGGNNPALARKIAEEHSKPKVVLYVVDYQYMLSPSVTKAWYTLGTTVGLTSQCGF